MPQIQLRNVHLAYGTQVLLDHVDLTLKKGRKIGLLGRNGTGKSSLLKLIAGDNKPDSGEVWVRPGTRIATLSQSLPDAGELTIFDVVASGLAELGAALAEFHTLAMHAGEADMKRLEELQHLIEAQDGWSYQQRIETTLQQLQLPADIQMKTLSGGWRRRVALAQALVCEPDVLLLDEPTNHLDIPTIQWLEEQLREFRGTVLVITHDRAFLQNVVNTIVELDRGRLFSQDSDYESFLRMRGEQLAAEETANALFDKRLAEEEKWIRQGVKARRTRNEGRVRALKAMRDDRSARRERQGTATFKVEAGERSGKIVAELENVSHSFGGQMLLRDFSMTLMRGDRVGLIGPNGAGKSTLLNILLGKLQPDSGTVKIGTNLEVAYFDQLLSRIDLNKTVIDNVAEGSDILEINGQRKHIISYLQEFLFAPDRIRQPVSALSGGERARLILAKLFSRSANVVVLDEPTNDLDIETLELLEEILFNFPGTLLLVSHDRAFLDNVVTSSLVFEGNGVVNEYIGSVQSRAALATAQQPKAEGPRKVAPAPKKDTPAAPATKARKLSYKERLELEALPEKIEATENAIAALEKTMAEPDFFTQPRTETEKTLKGLADKQAQLKSLYATWEALDTNKD